MNDLGIIHLPKGKFCIVDADTFDELNSSKWHLDNRGYVVRSLPREKCGKRSAELMHRRVNKTPFGLETDHENGFKIDNTRRNLRPATPAQNKHNLKKRSTPTSSIFKGVCFNKKTGQWLATIQYSSKLHYLGLFDFEIDAARAYNNEAKVRFGPFAKLNPV